MNQLVNKKRRKTYWSSGHLEEDNLEVNWHDSGVKLTVFKLLLMNHVGRVAQSVKRRATGWTVRGSIQSVSSRDTEWLCSANTAFS